MSEVSCPSPAVSHWLPEHVAGIAAQAGADLPVITAAEAVPVLPGLDLWDMWQLEHEDRSTVSIDGRALWFFLAVPRGDDPDLRHDRARIHLLTRGADGWRDHGASFPDGFAPGSREWSGSAVLADDGATLTMHFTASGRRGGPRTFEQRLFATTGRLVADGETLRIENWSPPVETVVADGAVYRVADQAVVVDGMIKGFRDPGWFRDPADGRDYILFTGSAGWVDMAYDGVIGIARRDGDRWTMLPPPLDAIGVNSEMERAHVIARGGLYYLFWSTQRLRFDPAGPTGPTGLYAMVADSIAGPWRPANGTGLVAANPPAEPMQAYCWWVTDELEVASFVDLWGVAGRPLTDDLRRAQFGGTVAPWFRLALDGDRVTIAE